MPVMATGGAVASAGVGVGCASGVAAGKPALRASFRCPRKPSGNMRLALAVPEGVTASLTTLRGTPSTVSGKRIRWRRNPLTRGACTTCWATFGSGWGIGTIRNTMSGRSRMIRLDRIRHPRAPGSCAGAPGTTFHGASASRTEVGTGRRSGTPILGFVVVGNCVEFFVF